MTNGVSDVQWKCDAMVVKYHGPDTVVPVVDPMLLNCPTYHHRAMAIIALAMISIVGLPAASVDNEFRELLLADENALQQIERIMASNSAFARAGAGLNEALMATKVRTVSDPVMEKYEAFLKRHPQHVRGHLAYASFLGEFGLDEKAYQHLDEAIRLAPDDPVALNNAANHYGRHGPAHKAFEYYEKAITAKPEESTYLRNCASVILLYRPEAKLFYSLPDEQAAFAKALAMYRRAEQLKPDDFLLASHIAQTHYHIRPFPYEAAVAAWEKALKLAGKQVEREGVLIHLARIHIQGKNFDAARSKLLSIELPELQDTRKKMLAGLPKAMEQMKFSPATKGPPLFNITTAPPPKAGN